METESLGKQLPRILFPYAQQWADRSGLTWLAKLLGDDQFRALIEKYGEELVRRMAQGSAVPGNGNGRRDGSKPASQKEMLVRGTDANINDLTNLNARVLAMEAQLEAQQAQFELFCTKIRPLALALGCCPECLAGVEGCPKCLGRSRVAHFPPDYTLLEALVVSPLAARGVPLILEERKVSDTGRQYRKSSPKRRRSKS